MDSTYCLIVKGSLPAALASTLGHRLDDVRIWPGRRVRRSIPIAPEAEIIVTEGNYLLLDRPEWRTVRRQLDLVWSLGRQARPANMHMLMYVYGSGTATADSSR